MRLLPCARMSDGAAGHTADGAGEARMITEIGIVAGEIWHYLDEHGETRFPQLAKGIQRQNELALMSLGWLAREGHVIVRQDGPEMIVSLRATGG